MRKKARGWVKEAVRMAHCELCKQWEDLVCFNKRWLCWQCYIGEVENPELALSTKK